MIVHGPKFALALTENEPAKLFEAPFRSVATSPERSTSRPPPSVTVPLKESDEGPDAGSQSPPAFFVAVVSWPSTSSVAVVSVHSASSLFDADSETVIVTGVGPLTLKENEKTESALASGMPGAASPRRDGSCPRRSRSR